MKSNLIENIIPKMLPVVPTMDVVVFPNQIVPLLVLDERIVEGINKALEEEPKFIFLLASKKQSADFHGAIGTDDLYKIGTIASVMRLIKNPDGGVKILVQGISKAKVNSIKMQDGLLEAEIDQLEFQDAPDDDNVIDKVNDLKHIAEKITISGNAYSPDFFMILSKMHDPEKIADFILSHLNLNVGQAQFLLEAETYVEYLEELKKCLTKELEVNQMQENIKHQARESMNQSQREFYLREQLKAIKRELGEDDSDDVEILRTKASSINLPDDVRTEVNRQLSRLEKTSPDSMESAVTRNHLDWILSLPWSVETKDNLDFDYAKKVLDEDHYGLKEIKERILDFVSIRKLKADGNTPILCFVGPPGTGKTSLGKSIARALGRNYFRISLGGAKDESEIRGHRRTYVGAMPGRFIQGMRKAGSCNPVIIVDELDKIGSDFRGDPSAAMLEVFDPQQNKTFYDNYLGVPFDLSKVMFIATANNLDTLSEPLKDRMEVIRLSGYTIEEKLNISKKYLVKKAILETGLESYEVKIKEDILSNIVSNYTRESGVRELERLIKKLCYKTARSLVENNKIISFSNKNLDKYLGPKRFIDADSYNENYVGISNGLAWTSYGGEVLKIEAVIMPGKGKLILTGSLGDVMKESAQAALSYVKAHAKEFGVEAKKFTHFDLHVHVPCGAIPKDGPSAGITLLSSILSALTERPISAEYAMTGELNLRGNVMPIGGVKEKILAAKRNGMLHVILPDKNKNDLIGSEDIVKGIDIIWVNHANEVLNKVLLPINKK